MDQRACRKPGLRQRSRRSSKIWAADLVFIVKHRPSEVWNGPIARQRPLMEPAQRGAGCARADSCIKAFTGCARLVVACSACPVPHTAIPAAGKDLSTGVAGALRASLTAAGIDADAWHG